jgi:RNA 3'-terminal phosphate cyclase (ATP)
VTLPASPRVDLDGSLGEGGGQILRTALSVSAVTGRGFSIDRIRAQRLKPGLRPQHREAARAIARIVNGRLAGDEVGSTELEFEPRERPRAGEWAFDIGTAGSTPLLLQTVCWPLALAGAPSSLTLRGGTHQDHAPSFHYLALIWAPAVARLGFRVSMELQAAGFYPEGGGEFTARIEPASPLPPLDLRHRGTLLDVEVVSMVGGLGYEVAERQAARAVRRLRDRGIAADDERVPVPARASKGGHVLIVATFERTRGGHGAVTSRDRSPEQTADQAVDGFQAYLSRGGAVDGHLGDQLLLPGALAVSGYPPSPPGVIPSVRYTVSEVTPHLLTNAEVLRRFLPAEVVVDGKLGEEGEVRIAAPASPGAAS